MFLDLNPKIMEVPSVITDVEERQAETIQLRPAPVPDVDPGQYLEEEDVEYQGDCQKRHEIFVQKFSKDKTREVTAGGGGDFLASRVSISQEKFFTNMQENIWKTRTNFKTFILYSRSY